MDDKPISTVEPLAGQRPPSVDDDISDVSYPVVCYSCGKEMPKLTCAACKVAMYCDRKCQKKDWSCKPTSGYHKLNCPYISKLTRSGKMDESLKRDVVNTVVRKCKLYLSPFFVYNAIEAGKAGTKGTSSDTKGYFVFLQSPDTLIMHGMPGQGRRDHLGPTKEGRGGSRQVILRFMKYEDTKELVEDDFELSQVLPMLQEAVSPSIPQNNIPLLVRFRCGFVGVCTSEIALGWDAAERLGWEGNDEVLFNIDDV